MMALVRATDPGTSLEAALGVDVKYSRDFVERLFSILEVPLADHELVHAAAVYGSRWTEQRIRTARKELTVDGVLVAVPGVFRETPTGHRAAVYTFAREKQ